jgi:hypothetical protein
LRPLSWLHDARHPRQILFAEAFIFRAEKHQKVISDTAFRPFILNDLLGQWSVTLLCLSTLRERSTFDFLKK